MTRVKFGVLLSAVVLALFVTQFTARTNAVGAGPDEPLLLTPPANATGVSTTPTLSAYVADPDGGMLTVKTSLRKANGEEFTIVALPDTQYYSQKYPATFTAQTQWIVDNRVARNIVFVTHEGDIVQNAGTASEWQRADTSMKLLEVAGIPFGAAPGNHDQPTNLYNQYFGVSRYLGRSYYGGHYSSNNDNNYELFSAGGMDFVILHLDYCPPAAVVTWATSILQSFPDRVGIVTTHALLDGSANRKAGGCTTQYLWDGLAVPNANLRFMLAGHISGESRRTDSVSGRTVHQLMADYQERSAGGQGFLRIMRFVPADNKVYVQTYSPTMGVFETDANSQFALDFTMGSTFQDVSTLSVIEGSDTEVTPAQPLSPFTKYEWRVTVTNGSGQTRVGPTWTFTTGSGSDIPNDPPAATPGSATVPEDASTLVTLQGSDPEGNPLTYTVVAGPAHGVLTGVAPNLTYQPAPNYFGSDSFTFRVNDGQLTSSPASIDITVQPVNDPPSAAGESNTTQAGVMLTVNAPGVLGNDTDLDSAGLTAVIGTGPSHGSLVLNADGSYAYTPAPGYSGADSFTYTASDGLSLSGPATVTLDIIPPPGSGNLKVITFEAGALASPASGADSTSGTVTLESVAPLKGSYSAKVATASSYLLETFPATPDLYLSFYLRVNALPSSDVQLLRIMNGSTQVGTFILRTGGQLRLRNNSTTIGSDSAALAVGQMYRIGIHQRAKVGSASNAVLEGFLAVADNPFAAPFASASNGTWATNATEIRLGSANSAVPNLVLDDIKLDNTSMPPGIAGPAAPTNVTASPLTATSVQVSWTDASSTETAFHLERAGANGIFAQVATVGTGVTTYTDTTVTPATAFKYRVRANNSGTFGPYSGVADVTTPDVPPLPPSGLGANASSSAVLLSWTDGSSNETLFSIERAGSDGIFAEITTTGAGVTSYNDASIAPNTFYNYRVRAANALGYSDYSNTVSLTTPLPPVPPSDPTGLGATAPASNRVELTWTDNSGNESLFRIERATGGGSFVEVGTAGANVVTFADTTVAAATAYLYRVRATADAVTSGYTSEVGITTPAAPALPALKFMTFETGTITDPTTGADVVSGTVTFETAAPLKGSRSAKITASAYIQEDFAATADLYLTFYLRLPAAPAADVRIALISNGGTTVGNLYLLATGKLRLRNGSSTIAADSAAMAVGTTYRVQVHQNSTTHLLEAFLVAGDAPFGPAFASLASAPFTGLADRIRIGGTNGSANIVVDDVRLDNTGP